MRYEWDSWKEAANILKHGVGFSEAGECFLDPDGVALVDTIHSKTEERHFWVGKSTRGRVLTIRYTRRGQFIRIYGAAEWRKFRELYNERAKHKKTTS